jgi:hypothetical protein
MILIIPGLIDMPYCKAKNLTEDAYAPVLEEGLKASELDFGD